MSNPELEEPSERLESFRITDLHSVDWWAHQFTATHNCAPGGVLLMFGGSVSLSCAAAAWFVAAWCIRTHEDKPAFPQILHVVPPKLGQRDVAAEICINIKNVLAAQGQDQASQDRAANECASRCFATSDGEQIINHLQRLPKFTAVAISCSERVRYIDLSVPRENAVKTHTGLRVNFAFSEELMLPHLYRLVENILQLAVEKSLAVVVLVEAFGPLHFPIPPKILSAKHLALMSTDRSDNESNRFRHILEAEKIRKNGGIQSAKVFVEQNIYDVTDRAIAIAELLEREQLFSAAWQTLLPHLETIRQQASGGGLLNAAQSAAAAGVANEAVSLLEEAWRVGLEDLETLNSAAIIARKLHAVNIWQKIVEAMRFAHPDHPWALARHYEWLFESNSFKEASVVARKLGNEFEAALCELCHVSNPQWDIFLGIGAATGRKDEALLIATSLALKMGELKLANRFIASVSTGMEVAAERVRLLIRIYSKHLATAQKDGLELADGALNEVFAYVAAHPDDTETRLDLVELFEMSLPDMPAIILLAKRCVDTYARWQRAAPNDAIDLASEPLERGRFLIMAYPSCCERVGTASPP